MKPPVTVELPPRVVTMTFCAPEVPAGEVRSSRVLPVADRPVAAAPPIVTPVTLERFAPVITTADPPAVGPTAAMPFTSTSVTAGAS